MPRLVIVGDGDSEREFSIPAPVSRWEPAPATPVILDRDLATIFTELREPLFRYLLALGVDSAEAEEVLQETFLRLCQHLASNRQQANLRGWIFRVAHNLARDGYRRRKRRPAQSLHDAQANIAVPADPRATPEEQAIAREQKDQLVAAWARLPANQQHCLHLRAEGLRYREIADVLGVGTSTVAEWVQQALKTLGKGCHEQK